MWHLTESSRAWYVSDTLQLGHFIISPQAGHIMRVEYPRLLRKSIVCLSCQKLSTISSRSLPENTAPPSYFMSAISTVGRGLSSTLSGRDRYSNLRLSAL